MLDQYEVPEIEFVRRYLRGSPRVVELGAGIGVVTAHILDVMDSDGDCVIVEADDRILHALRRTIARHRKRHGIRIVKGVIGDGTSAAFMRDPLFLSNSADFDSKGTGSVRTLHLREVVEPTWETYDLVCDIEGAEAVLINDPDSCEILRRCSRLVIEFHPTTFSGKHYEPRDLIDRFNNVLGFDLIESLGRIAILENQRVAVSR